MEFIVYSAGLVDLFYRVNEHLCLSEAAAIWNFLGDHIVNAHVLFWLASHRVLGTAA